MEEFQPISYTVAAQILEPTDTDYEEIENATKGFFAASETPFENGKPRMLFISAWIVHEGRNLNGDAFIAEELQARTNQGLFTPPFAGMIDLDHDFTARGFWYKANYAFDQAANKWGILSNGAVWAWRYKDLAEFMKAEMADKGFVNVSMSAIAEAVEPTFNFAGAEGQKTYIRHNPVFFTSAILTVPPGDQNAKGTVSVMAQTDNSGAGLDNSRADAHSHIEEKNMTENEFKELQEANAQLNKEVADLKVKLTEAEVNFKAISDLRITAEKELETIRAELKTYRDKEIAEAERAKEVADKTKFESRLAEVPKGVKENLDKHSNKELVLARWKDASDAEWDIIKQSFALAYTAPTYLSRSQEEGKLPVGRKDDEIEKDTLKSFLKD